MNSTKWLTYLVCLYLGLITSAKAQINCGTEALTALEESAFSASLNAPMKNLRRSSYALAINAVIVHPDTSFANFNNDDVSQLIEQANLYFSKIGLSFYLRTGAVKNVNNAKYQNFSTTNEAALRKEYDALDAINIYFVKSIKDKDGVLLNGYSSQPSYNASSNKLFFSYANNNPEDFKILREKTFLHEFGHYFGLLHTFQNSNHETISKRELVVRGINGNCATTGDEICDTPADPFDRLQTASVFNCTAAYPDNLKDANGDVYKVFFDNLMSYHIGCGNTFTEQQYERMESALNMRLSPSAEYQISAQKEANFISIKPLKKKIYCAGETITVGLETTGLFKDDNVYSLEISDQYGSNFNIVESDFLKDSVKITLPDALVPGTGYRFKINASSPAISSFISESFQVKTSGQIKLSAQQTAINLGEQAILKVSMTGGGTWSFILNDSMAFSNIYSSELEIPVKPSQDTLYRILNAEYLCGVKVDTQYVAISVISPSITISDSFEGAFCKNEIIKIPVSGLNIENIAKYRVVLKGINNSYIIQPNISPFSVNFLLPVEVMENETYEMKLTGEGLGDFSKSISLTIKETPGQPRIISPVKYCFNSPSTPLTAEGDSLLWFLAEKDGKVFSSITPPTTADGVYFYYVSEASASGCYSERSKIEVQVKPPVTANLSGSSTIISGDSTKLKIELTGDAPWNIQMQDGSLFTSETATFEYFVTPSSSTAYSLKKVENFCGNGFISGLAEVEVILPLASSLEQFKPLLVYPIPADNYLDIVTNVYDQKEVKIELYDLNGKVVLSDNFKTDQGLIRIKLPRVNSGSYILKVNRDKKSDSKKVYIR